MNPLVMSYIDAGDIVQLTDIAQHIGKIIPLTAQGKNYSGHCPFHEEKTPVFSVSAEKGTYSCFGCGASGNVINFYRDYYRIPLIEAMARIVEENPFPLPQRYVFKKETRNNILIAIKNDAQEYYQNNITPSIRSYLHHNGYDDDAILRFELGFAPDNKTGLLDHLSRKYSLSDILHAGMISLRKDADPDSMNPRDYNDRFIDQIMFPIKPQSGTFVLGFSARRNPAKDPAPGEFSDTPPLSHSPEFIYSPECKGDIATYSRRRTLYGLDRIYSMLRQKKEIVVSEGYMDVDIGQMQGISVVGTCGTALTSEQATLLSTIADTIVLTGDAHDDHITATKNAFTILVPSGKEIRRVALSSSESDAVSPTNAYADRSFDKSSFVDFFVTQRRTRKDFDALPRFDIVDFYAQHTPAKAVDADTHIRSLIDCVSHIEQPFTRAGYFKKIATKYPELSLDSVIATHVKTLYSNPGRMTISHASKRFLNSAAANFVAHLLIASQYNLAYAAAAIREVPLEKIPADGSLFDRSLREFYVHILDAINAKNPDTIDFILDNQYALFEQQSATALKEFEAWLKKNPAVNRTTIQTIRKTLKNIGLYEKNSRVTATTPLSEFFDSQGVAPFSLSFLMQKPLKKDLFYYTKILVNELRKREFDDAVANAIATQFDAYKHEHHD